MHNKLHIAEEVVVEHKLTSFSDGGSCSLPVFLDDRQGFCSEIPEEGSVRTLLREMGDNLGNLAFGDSSRNLVCATLSPWQTRTHCCGHIVADTNVSLFARARNICCGHKFWGELKRLTPAPRTTY